MTTKTKTEKKAVSDATIKKAAKAAPAAVKAPKVGKDVPLCRHPAYRNARRQGRKGFTVAQMVDTLTKGGFSAADAKTHAEHLHALGAPHAKAHAAKQEKKASKKAAPKAEAKAPAPKAEPKQASKKAAPAPAPVKADPVREDPAPKARPEWCVDDKGAIPAWVKAQTGGMDRKAIVAKWGEGARFRKDVASVKVSPVAAASFKAAEQAMEAAEPKQTATQKAMARVAKAKAAVKAIAQQGDAPKLSELKAVAAELVQATGQRGMVIKDEVEGTQTLVPANVEE